MLALLTAAFTGLNCGSAPPRAAATAPQPATEPTRAETLVLGTIGDNPQEVEDKKREWPRFFAYMIEHLKPYGIKSMKLAQCRNPAQMAAWMREGKVDLFDEAPLSAYITHRIGDGVDEPIANRWKNYNEKFGGVIFAKKNGSIHSLQDLKGKMVAFRGDTSVSQYFLQKVFLIQQGYKLVEKSGPTEPVKPDEIGYYFAWSSRDKVVEDVMDGRAAAGGNSDEFMDKLLGHEGKEGGKARHPREGVPQTRLEDVTIIARTPLVLRRLFTARKTLDPKLKAALKAELVKMHTTPEGRAVLESCGPSAKFTLIDSEDVAYAGVADQGEFIEQEIKKFAAQPLSDSFNVPPDAPGANLNAWGG